MWTYKSLDCFTLFWQGFVRVPQWHSAENTTFLPLHGQPRVPFGFLLVLQELLQSQRFPYVNWYITVQLDSYCFAKKYVKYTYFDLPQNSLYSFETMADYVVRPISDSFRTGFCYAQQGCAQCDTAPFKVLMSQKIFFDIW